MKILPPEKWRKKFGGNLGNFDQKTIALVLTASETFWLKSENFGQKNNLLWHFDTRHNNFQYNDSQQNDTEHNDTRLRDTQLNKSEISA